MPLPRRTILKAGLTLLTLTGLPAILRAAVWPKEAFQMTAASAAIKGLYGTDKTTFNDQIELTAPLVAENGAIVPVTVSTTLADVQSISIIVEKNPRPLAASFVILEKMTPEISCRIKIAETSTVMAIAETRSGLFHAEKEVTVTVGGCS